MGDGGGIFASIALAGHNKRPFLKAWVCLIEALQSTVKVIADVYLIVRDFSLACTRKNRENQQARMNNLYRGLNPMHLVCPR